jgi:hypothetical protein
MPSSSSDEADRVEAQIRSIPDPVQRAVCAVAAHRSARERARRMTAVRRDALIDLHQTGMTWQEVANAVGMSLKAVAKASAEHGSSAGAWWKRMPDAEADRHKRGPGGVPLGQVVRKEQLMQAALEVMSAREESREASERPVPITPSELLERVSERLGRRVSMASLRVALVALVRDGTVVKVTVGRYAAVHPGDGRSGSREPTSPGR